MHISSLRISCARLLSTPEHSLSPHRTPHIQLFCTSWTLSFDSLGQERKGGREMSPGGVSDAELCSEASTKVGQGRLGSEKSGARRKWQWTLEHKLDAEENNLKGQSISYSLTIFLVFFAIPLSVSKGGFCLASHCISTTYHPAWHTADSSLWPSFISSNTQSSFLRLSLRTNWFRMLFLFKWWDPSPPVFHSLNVSSVKNTISI